MKVVIQLNKTLMAQAKKFAEKRGITFDALVHQALRRYMSQKKMEQSEEKRGTIEG